MAGLGIRHYRFSISWSRLVPGATTGSPASAAGVSFYNSLINEMLRYNITPYATLYHWDLPQALQVRGLTAGLGRACGAGPAAARCRRPPALLRPYAAQHTALSSCTHPAPLCITGTASFATLPSTLPSLHLPPFHRAPTRAGWTGGSSLTLPGTQSWPSRPLATG